MLLARVARGISVYFSVILRTPNARASDEPCKIIKLLQSQLAHKRVRLYVEIILKHYTNEVLIGRIKSAAELKHLPRLRCDSRKLALG
jgi:hypothetical protein